MPRKTKLAEKLKKQASTWTANIVRKANESDKPRHIKVTGKTFVKGNTIDMEIYASSRQGDARAYEYGSGIHSRLPNISPMQQGRKGYIIIKPKRKKLLAFHWDTMNQIMDEFGIEAVREALRYSHKFVGFSEDGRYLFKYVEHPGVEAAGGGKGYIGPAVTSERARIRKEIPAEVRSEIILEINKSFRKSKGE